MWDLFDLKTPPFFVYILRAKTIIPYHEFTAAHIRGQVAGTLYAS